MKPYLFYKYMTFKLCKYDNRFVLILNIFYILLKQNYFKHYFLSITSACLLTR